MAGFEQQALIAAEPVADRKRPAPTPELKISQLTKKQLGEAVNVITRAFNDASLSAAARKDLAHGFSMDRYKPVTFVATLGRRIAGTIQCIPDWINFNTFGIDWVAVDPQDQGKGIARALVNHAESHIKRQLNGKSGSIILADVTSRRKPSAQGYYIKLGYEEGPRMHDGAPLMLKNLNSSGPV